MQLNANSKEPLRQYSVLEKYHKFKFCCVCLPPGKKHPTELAWQKSRHRDLKVWQNWLDQGNNIGILTGTPSGITVIDIDKPEEFEKSFGKTILQINTAIVKTKKGYHLYFMHCHKLSNKKMGYMEVFSDGGQVMAPPSEFDGVQRVFIKSLSNIQEMPKDLIDFILTQKSTQAPTPKVIPHETALISEGTRNNALIQFGGYLRTKMSLDQVTEILSWLNQNIVGLPNEELENTIFRSLAKYEAEEGATDVEIVYQEILLRWPIFFTELKQGLGIHQQKLSRILNILAKQGRIDKTANGAYRPVIVYAWEKLGVQESSPPKYIKIPFFSELGNVAPGENLLLQGLKGMGKTFTLLNVAYTLRNKGYLYNDIVYGYTEARARINERLLKMGLELKAKHLTKHTQVFDNEAKIIFLDLLPVLNYAETENIMHEIETYAEKEGKIVIVAIHEKETKEQGPRAYAQDMIQKAPALIVRVKQHKDNNSKFTLTRLFCRGKPKKSTLELEINWGNYLMSICGGNSVTKVGLGV